MRQFKAGFVLALILGGCTVGPDFVPPDDGAPAILGDLEGRKPISGKLAASQPVAEAVDPVWWRLFGDPTLSALVERVAGENLDVQLATTRLAESRAQLGITSAAQFPQLRGSGSYFTQQASNKGIFALLGPAAAGSRSGGIKGSKLQPFDLYSYGFDASWELDLWGRVSRSIESSDATLAASAEMRRDALLSAMAEVARDYIQLRGVQASLGIAANNLRTSQQSLGLVQERAAAGLTNDLDVANASAQVSTIDAELPRLQQQQAQLINAIGLLLGQEPGMVGAELLTAKPVPPVPPLVPVGLPGELARRRPDIRQAEAELHSATAEIGVAVASFYPTVTLSGSIGIQALRAKDLTNWDAHQYSFGPAITIPIFEGGRLKANLALHTAQQQEAALKYQQVVLRSWHEVDNALTAYDAEQHRREALARAVELNRRALGLAQTRYSAGVADFLSVLEAQRSLLATEQSLAESTAAVSGNLVSIYKALGGGWETAFPVDATIRQQR